MFAWWGPVIWETYGGMEGAATIAKPHQWEKYPGTVGRAIRGVTIKILDDDGNELPPNTIGNIYIGTEGHSFEYKDDEEQTKSAYRGKLFTIGDVGEMNEEGFLFIRDRAKDMIITGGVNVYPQEVEAALLTHPKIADVAVIGLPDQEWGESIKAVVQLKPEASASDQLAEEIIAFCKQLLASYKCPRSVDFRDSLPRTDAGKLYKRQLRDEYAAKK
jgi:long-chain acyl-CoA synthetase